MNYIKAHFSAIVSVENSTIEQTERERFERDVTKALDIS